MLAVIYQTRIKGDMCVFAILSTLVLLTGCSSTGEVDEYGWEQLEFDELVELEFQLREEGGRPLQPEPERFAADQHEAQELIEGCMEENGFPNVREGLDALKFPFEQRDAAVEQFYDCDLRFPRTLVI